MPVVQASYSRLSEMAGAPADKIRRRLPHLGLDIEHEDGDIVHVEYSPNRPDYSTEYGISLGLQGILGIQTGIIPLIVKPPRWRMTADESVRNVRRAVTGILATGGNLDDHTIKQIISMQEDIHQGLGRGRRRVAIGLHDADKLEPPISYHTVGEDHRFVPLGGTEEMAVRDILLHTEQGRQYGGLIEGDRYPVIAGKSGAVASMPPVINSDVTVLTKDTSNLFVDVTGHRIRDVENALAVICITLQAAGFSLEGVAISGAGNRTPRLNMRRMPVDIDMMNQTLGLQMDVYEVAECIKKSRLGVQMRGEQLWCTIPPYRFDIFGPMDLVEEAALGYGIDRMEPVVPAGRRPGKPHPTTMHADLADRIMTGLGYTQTASPGLASGESAARAGMKYHIRVANPKSKAHSALRTSLLPGLLEILSRNIHEPYPHRLYETGWVFGKDVGASESLHLACITAHKDASYSEIRSVLHAALYRGANIANMSTPPYDAAPYSKGRAAAVMVGNTSIGSIGEIDPDILQSFKLRKDTRVAAFEIDIGLIFGNSIRQAAP